MTARRPGAEALADISAQRFVVQLEYLRQAAAGLRAPDPVPPELAQVARWSERPELVRAWLWAADALERGESDVDGGGARCARAGTGRAPSGSPGG